MSRLDGIVRIVEHRSSDGTRLYVEEHGEGPPLVLVHGGLSTTRAFDRVVPTLSRRFRCLSLGRRGYGQSADTPPHSYDREAEDVIAVLLSLGEPAHVLAHSSGAIVALQAALMRQPLVRSLVLYEPPLPIRQPLDGPWIERAEAAVANGDNELAAVIGLREGVGLPPEQLELARSDQSWPSRISLAPAWVREFRAVAALPLGASRYSALGVPTLLLVGDRTPAHHAEAVDALHAVLPHSTVEVLPGQGHAALATAPNLVCDAVLRFAPRRARRGPDAWPEAAPHAP